VFENGYPDHQTLERLYDERDFQRACQAYLWSLPAIPTPRWTTFDEVRFGIKMAPEVTRVLQERAYSSPIWYTP
jgi:hypothetical protein